VRLETLKPFAHIGRIGIGLHESRLRPLCPLTITGQHKLGRITYLPLVLARDNVLHNELQGVVPPLT